MATVEQLEAGVRKAYESGNMEYARIFGAELVRARNGGQVTQQATQESTQESGIGDQLARQAGLTIRAGAEGLAGAAGVLTDPIAALANVAGANLLPLRESVSGILTRAGVPQAESETEKVVQAAAQGLAGGAGVVGAGRALAGAAQPVMSTVGKALATQPAQQLAGAAGAGGASELARQEGAGTAGQIAAGLAGGVAGAGATGLRTAARPPIQNVDEASRLGIDVATSDVMPPRTFVGRAAQVAGERIPVAGTGGMRETQQAQRIEAVKSTLKDFGAFDHADIPESVMRDLAGKRAEALTKYSGAKREVMTKLDSSGAVPVEKTISKIDDEIAKLQAVSAEGYSPVIKQLEQFKSDIQGKNLTNIEGNRKLLGEAFKAPELVAVRGEGEKAVGRIYGALREDINGFIKTKGDKRDITKWQVANRRLSEMAGELKNTALKSTLKRGDVTPEVVNNMLFSTKPSEIKALYANLTNEGRANARAAILDEALKKAGGIENLSPDKFKNQLQRRGESVNVFFRGDEKKQIDGLIRALEITKRAGEFAAHPPTGTQLYAPVGAAVLTDLFGGMGAGLVSGVTIGGMARVYESPAMRNILQKLPSVKQGSKEEAALFKRLLSVAQSVKEE